MVGLNSINRVNEKIAAIEQRELTEQSAVTLAALYVLRREWADVPVADVPAVSEVSQFSKLLSIAEDELSGADMYHAMGLDDIARDELRHFRTVIERARGLAVSSEEVAAVNDAQLRHDLMVQGIGI